MRDVDDGKGMKRWVMRDEGEGGEEKGSGGKGEEVRGKERR